MTYKNAFNHLVFWYQRKIGSYDKQDWEKNFEKELRDRFPPHPFLIKKAKPKTDLIDVDLVSGSSFPKAKAKHGFVTAAYLAFKRLIFLPFCYKWWIEQTSFMTYILFLFMYFMQLLNIHIYCYYYPKDSESDIITMPEVLIPLAMMFALCIVHTQIVSTHYAFTKPEFKKIRNIFVDDNLSNAPKKKDPKTSNTKIKNNKGQFSKAPDSEKLKQDSSNLKNQKNQSDPLCNNTDVKQKNEKNLKCSKCNIISSSYDKEITSGKVEVNTENNRPKKRERQSVAEKCMEFLQREFSDMDDNEDELDSPGSEQNSLQSSREDQRLCESEEERQFEGATNGNNLINRIDTIATSECMGVTTNSDECSYSSEFDESDSQSDNIKILNSSYDWEFPVNPRPLFLCDGCSTSDRISCTIWDHRDIKKAELSVLEISSAIITRVESMSENMDYFYFGILLSIFLSLLPSLRRMSDNIGVDTINQTIGLVPGDISTAASSETYSDFLCKILYMSFGSSLIERSIVIISAFQRFVLSFLLFFLLAVAERTYKQRLLYAKLFSHLTSSRRARKSDLPHFRLNKVRNIKTWLSVRSYLKRRGPQRSVDVIVSSTFVITLVLLAFVSFELIKDLESLHTGYNVEALFWSFSLGMYILRFMTLGTKVNKKYRNLSVLITEQINLYLQIELKPHKKDELMVANSVLKLAADLIKELENPFKISGLSTNPYLYTVTKVVLLSALSGVLSELLGFKLKLHKIKIK